MKNAKSRRIPTLTAVGAAAVLTLTACSSSENFDFTERLEGAPASIKFSVPSDLGDLHEDYADNRIFDSITIRAIESEDPSMCAVRYDYDYARDGLDRLVEFAENLASVYPVEERVSSLLTNKSPGDEQVEVEEDYSSAVLHLDCSPAPREPEETVGVVLTYVDTEEDSLEAVAGADVSVMRGSGSDGELYIQEYETPDWRVDSNGNWIAD
jgi:hypothetical protein